MKTKQQYTRAYQLARRWGTIWFLCFTALLVYLSLRVGTRFEHWFNIHDWAEFSWIGINLILFIAGTLGIARLLYRHYGLICPSCGDWITSQPAILRTGKCPRCKNEMFHDA